MSEDRGRQPAQGYGPPQSDESWWAAVLQDEGIPSETKLARGGPRPSGSPSTWGSAEDWVWARGLYESDDTIDLPVVGFNRGGLLVEARTLRGFVPVSHLLDVEQSSDDSRRQEVMESSVGNPICLKVIEFDPERGRLVFSQRAAQAGPGKRIELLETLEVGQRVTGKVTNITAFGVFVDLGGVEGLVHVSELSWGRVRHPSDVVRCGQALEVAVLSIDRDQVRVALSLKELLPDPWKTVDVRFSVGDLVDGIVTNVVKFGAFVGIEEGLEGLIHVSELGDEHYPDPSALLAEGDRVRVRIIHIDAGARRLGLSLRGLDEPIKDIEEAESAREAEALSSF
jgi:small subunit ribosomal protein S1